MESTGKSTKTIKAVPAAKASQLMVPTVSNREKKLPISETAKRSPARTKVNPKGLIDNLHLTEDSIMAITNLATSFSRTCTIDQKDLEDGSELDRKSVKKKTEVILGAKTEKVWVKAHIEKSYHKKAESGSRGKDGDPEEEEESNEPETEEDDDIVEVDGPMNSTIYESFQE